MRLPTDISKHSHIKLNVRMTGNVSYCRMTQIEVPDDLFHFLQVDLSFSPAQSLPASPAHLRVTASPQSLCALRAVDQSVLLEAELSPASVSSLRLKGQEGPHKVLSARKSPC